MVDLTVDSSIQQLNVTYHAEQDRLLLRIGLADSSEILLWLTRRVLKTWWPMLQQSAQAASPEVPDSVADPMQREIMQEFAREAAIHKLDFSEPYQQARENRLQRPLLIEELHLIEGANSPTVFEIKALNGQMLRINLNDELILGLVQMLALVSEKTDWDLALSNDASTPLTLAPSAVH